MVSIHAPREGCDSQAAISSKRSQCFNSRTPGGVRRTRGEVFAKTVEFQFTHPGRGATAESANLLPGRKVSIHAPREGCDEDDQADKVLPLRFQFTHPGRGATIPIVRCWIVPDGFNSRTPGGVRLRYDVMLFVVLMFQFTHPGRGATLSHQRYDRLGLFQFTHPGRGATVERCEVRRGE